MTLKMRGVLTVIVEVNEGFVVWLTLSLVQLGFFSGIAGVVKVEIETDFPCIPTI